MLHGSLSSCLVRFREHTTAHDGNRQGPKCVVAQSYCAYRQHRTARGVETDGQRSWLQACIAWSPLRRLPLAYEDHPATDRFRSLGRCYWDRPKSETCDLWFE